MIRPGDRTGPYRWIRLIGRGSSSEVWAARRDGRAIAVKVFRGKGRRSTFEEAIRRETRIGRLIRGVPGVVAVRRVESLEGNLYLEMEWVRGPSLDQVLAGRLASGRGPIPRRVAVDWAVEVLETLDAVGHRVAPARPNSFLHRDIKPGNLLLRPDTGRVAITDFGVARAEAALGFETTAAGVVKGSPRFMAPEILMEDPLDTRTDQFALAVVLYELLTGRPLYPGQDITTIFEQVLLAEVEPALSRLDVPIPLETVLRTMLSRNPEGRFPSAAVAAEALRDLHLEGPTARALLPELLDHSEPDAGGEGYAPRPGEDTVVDHPDDEPTLVDHPDDEATLLSEAPLPREPTWETEALDGGAGDPAALDEETELMDVEDLARALRRHREE